MKNRGSDKNLGMERLGTRLAPSAIDGTDSMSPFIPGILLRPDLQGNLRVCKECQEIFQEFHTAKMKQEPNPNQSNGESPADGSLSPRSGNTPIKSLDPLQPPESPIIRAGSGNYTRSTLPMSVLSPHKSWDDGSSSRSQEIEQSPSHTNVEFDNPTPLHSRRQSSYDSLHLATERDERLLALEEVGTLH